MNYQLNHLMQALQRNGQLWMATSESAEAAEYTLAAIASGALQKPDGVEAPEIYTSVDELGLGVVHVKGNLVNEDSPLNPYFGLQSYSGIQEAVQFAADDSATNAIILDISSNGGQASGIPPLSEFVLNIDRNVKPVYAIGSESMCSAALWLGLSARETYATPETISGSIGVLAVHTEITKMLADAGISKTVLRVGDFKALGHPAEKFTPEAREQIMVPMQGMYNNFLGFVSGRVGMNPTEADSRIGQGRIFYGQEAERVGLVRRVAPFDTLVGHVYSKTLDTRAVSQAQFGRNIR